ncbi:hypothetical protein DFH06DRAFT_1470830 [Mycena polygramma]|nr:hypothetical protein DFH06DRAFT_1470830 [Mycena polygramma]
MGKASLKGEEKEEKRTVDALENMLHHLYRDFRGAFESKNVPKKVKSKEDAPAASSSSSGTKREREKSEDGDDGRVPKRIELGTDTSASTQDSNLKDSPVEAADAKPAKISGDDEEK